VEDSILTNACENRKKKQIRKPKQNLAFIPERVFRREPAFVLMA
jgi:hypothetical protein